MTESELIWKILNKISGMESLLLTIRENADPHLQRTIDRYLDLEETDSLIRELRSKHEAN